MPANSYVSAADCAAMDAETLPQAIRNYLAHVGAAVNGEICLHLIDRATPRAVLSVIADMEAAGEITRTVTREYVLGHHAPTAAADLVLTSNDPHFGQPMLF